MGLFDLFRKKTITVEDPLFGLLKLLHFGSAESYWSGEIAFAPTGSQCGLLIAADAAGPTERQRAFYVDIRDNFDDYIPKITPLIEDEFRNWKEDFNISDFHREFQLEHLEIPPLAEHNEKWDMAFTTVHDLNHQVTITFYGAEAKEILIDG